MISKTHKLFVKILAIFVVLIVIAAILTLIFVLNRERNEKNPSSFKNAIVTCGVECADIGMNIMKRGGSVADAGVAVLICEGIVCPQVF